jgi:hypothetical protein
VSKHAPSEIVSFRNWPRGKLDSCSETGHDRITPRAPMAWGQQISPHRRGSDRLGYLVEHTFLYCDRILHADEGLNHNPDSVINFFRSSRKGGERRHPN